MIWARLRSDTAALDRLERKLPERANVVLETVARGIVEDVNRSFYQGHPPSPVGGPPAIVSGDLMKNVTIFQPREANGRFTFGKVIRYTVPYASVLETEDYNPSIYHYNRPFLEVAVDRAANYFNIAWEGLFRI